MPHLLTFANSEFIQRFWGDVSAGEILAGVAEITGSPHFDHARLVVLDVLDTQSFDFNREVAESVAAIRIGATRTNAGIRVVVIAHDHQLLDVRRMLREPPLSYTRETWFFRTLDEAREWHSRQPPLRAGRT